MKIEKICVLGGTGFVGRYLVARLDAQGKRMRVLTRRRERHRHLLVLPRTQVVQADVRNPASLREQFAGVDAVINLIGILNERGHNGEGFRRAHLEIAEKVVAACKQQGVGRLLHMSALHADADKGPSHYLRSKGEAADYVHAAAGSDLAATSFHPSVIFGPEDDFFNRFARLLSFAYCLPLACSKARFAPVYVGDVAKAFVDALEDVDSFGQRYDLCGPRAYTFKELVEYTATVLGKKRCILGLPDFLSSLQATLFEYFPGKPFSRDNYASLQIDSVCAPGDTCPTPLEAIVPRYLGKQSRQARYQNFRRSAHRDGS